MKQVEKEIQQILKDYNCRLHYRITFPQYRVLPEEVQLALSVLARHGMKITIEIKE